MINNIKPGDTIRFNEYLVGVAVQDEAAAIDVAVDEGDLGKVVKKLKDGRTIVKVGNWNFLFMTSAIKRQELVNTDNVV